MTSQKAALRLWIGGFALGLVLIVAILFLRPDLRGWTPATWAEPAIVVEPLREGGGRFLVGDCLPGTIDPHRAPSSLEYSGPATETILACRSRASAYKIMLLYLLVASSYPAYCVTIRRRGR